MMPASITPPNTNLAMSIKNFPISNKIASLLSFFMFAKVRRISYFPAFITPESLSELFTRFWPDWKERPKEKL